MRKVKCGECGKTYDYDEDPFCPKCGAFNQAGREAGAVKRTDGLSEVGHRESFLHKEFHAEEQVRRRSGLDQPPARTVKPAQRSVSPGNRGNQTKQLSPVGRIIWFVFALIALNVIVGLFSALFGMGY
jgi:hypothetical protein